MNVIIIAHHKQLIRITYAAVILVCLAGAIAWAAIRAEEYYKRQDLAQQEDMR